MKGYPKLERLRDGTPILLRPMAHGDEVRVKTFYKSLPEEDRLFLRDDVTRDEVVDRWFAELDYDRVLPILALTEDESEVLACATLHRYPHGWQRHVGEIRVVVAHHMQRRGLGSLMARVIVTEALKAGLDKLVAAMMVDQLGARRAFSRLGFIPEATLKDHVMDLKGRTHDLLIMTQNVKALWEEMEQADKAQGRPMEH
jgi:RimJ/RimL family protein N-acetyltransferase